jgi:hypothetical protein
MVQWMIIPGVSQELAAQKQNFLFISHYLLYVVGKFAALDFPASFTWPELILSTNVYINRLAWQRKIVITKENVLQLMAVSLRLFMKWQEDDRLPQREFAKMAGFGLREFNAMERSFANLLEHTLWISPQEYERALRELELSAEQVALLMSPEHFHGASTGALT